MSRLPHLPLMPIVAVLALLAGSYLAFTTGSYIIHNYQLRQDERALRADVERLDREHDELTAVKDYLKSDEYIEYVARNTIGLVRQGETLVIVSGTTPAAAPTPAGTPVPPGAWWQELFRDNGPVTTPTPLAR